MSGVPRETDLLVIGGGINGVGIARDAAGRGLRVTLCEQDDLASATSQASSKLVHGGLRYLEHLELRLVRESLRERELLLKNAPHLVRPMQFVLPQTGSPRPAWMVRLGLVLYDLLKGRSVLPRSRRVDLRKSELGAGVQPEVRKAFVYPDCYVDDARLVVNTAVDAAERGCSVLTRTRFDGARRDGDRGLWVAELYDAISGTRFVLHARAIVNAAGPWVASMLETMDVPSRHRLRHVKGSHIVVPRRYPGGHAFLLQNDDRRVVFVIPFDADFTMIGTTEVDVDDPASPSCSEAETDYLCRAASRFLVEPVRPSDVVWSFAGVRPLLEDGSTDAGSVTRDYVLEVDDAGAPVLSVFGGKLTTHRRLAERVVDRLRDWFPDMGGSWTAAAALPGAGSDADGVLATAFPDLPSDLLTRLARRHGTRAEALLAGVRDSSDLGEHFGADLWAREVDWLVAEEWARTSEDVLWRRTKAGLRLDSRQRARVAAYLAERATGSNRSGKSVKTASTPHE